MIERQECPECGWKGCDLCGEHKTKEESEGTVRIYSGETS
jgi:hypothetical protein